MVIAERIVITFEKVVLIIGWSTGRVSGVLVMVYFFFYLDVRIHPTVPLCFVQF